MILINLLPHREMRRRASIVRLSKWAVFTGIVGALVVVSMLLFLGASVKVQFDYNNIIEDQIREFDLNIREIDSIRAEIKGLEARINAVEALQRNRNNSVVLFRELAKITPEGIRLTSVSQESSLVTVTGMANNQELISQYLGRMSDPNGWFDTPELIEIKAAEFFIRPKRPETVYVFGLRVARNAAK